MLCENLKFLKLLFSEYDKITFFWYLDTFLLHIYQKMTSVEHLITCLLKKMGIHVLIGTSLLVKKLLTDQTFKSL